MTNFNASVRTWQDADNYLGTRDKRTIGHNTILARRDDEAISVKYHNSAVVVYFAPKDDCLVTLNSCGWRTMTTKERINEFCPSGFSVYQERGTWTLSRRGENPESFTFADGITIDTYGRVFNAGPANEKERVKKLTQQIRKYANAYSAALIAGQVPEPSNGDCWGCLMVDEHGKTAMGSDHLLSHLEESYFVPALLIRSIESRPMCQFAMGALGTIWGKVPDRDPSQVSEWEREILTRDVVASIVHYYKHELNLAG
jgi:hypothetical protein